MSEINHKEITERVKSLILKNKVSDYYVWKNAVIPRATLSVMINNKSSWKLEYLISIANLFSVSFNWLLFGEDDYEEQQLIKENLNLREQNIMLKEEVETYRVIRKNFIEKSPTPIIEVGSKTKGRKKK